MFSIVQGYLMIAGTAIMGVLIAIFKYRGNKVDELEEDLVAAQASAHAIDKYQESKDKVSTFEADNRVAAAEAHNKDMDEISDKFYSI